jgi:ubiquinone/menaquinone biosynthesis C-methylase UbiE
MVKWNKWFYKKAPKILEGCGVRPGNIVIDFGAGEGDYTIPLAVLVSQENLAGKVIAIEEDEYDLNKLEKKAQKQDLLKFIEIINNNGELTIPKASNKVDGVLVFDILHYFTKQERDTLYKEINRVVRQNGLLITFPHHYRDLYPLWNLSDISLKEIINEIEAHNFQLKYRWEGELIHDHGWYRDGIILTFQKQ